MNLPHNGTDTSIDAAASVAPSAEAMRIQVARLLFKLGKEGATNYEIVDSLGMKLQTVCARANELWRDGVLVDSGDRRVTPSGRKAKVWRHRFWAR